MTYKAFLTIALLGLSVQGYSCKCGDTPTIEDSFKGSSVIVHGRVLSKKLVSLDQTMDVVKAADLRNKLKDDHHKLEFLLAERIIEIKFVVKESFKGSVVGDTLTIYTPGMSGSCRYWFDVDKEYIVYNLKSSWLYRFVLSESEENDFEREGTYWAYSCTRTTEYAESEALELRNKRNEFR